MALRGSLTAFLFVATGLSGCAILNNTTERRTTATLRFNEAARSVEQAQDEVRAMCGTAEVLSVSPPRPASGPGGAGLMEVTATCLATFDGRGDQTENKT